MNNRDELEAALRANAAMEVPTPDPAFVDALEQRLRAGGSARVVPLARRARRFGATTLVVTLVLTGAAAAAGLVLTDPFGGDDEAPGAGATTSAAPTTEDVTTVPATTVDETATTLAVVTTTTQPAAAPAVTTTEVHVPATISLECHATGVSTQCTWGPLPAGTTKLLVLRGQSSPSGPGRVFAADIGSGVWTDPMPTPGVTYSFVLHAFDASDTDLGHSNLVMVDCC